MLSVLIWAHEKLFSHALLHVHPLSSSGLFSMRISHCLPGHIRFQRVYVHTGEEKMQDFKDSINTDI